MTLLVVHAAATWFMVGMIWTIQAVHYPLFAAVGDESFRDYEAAHTRRMGRLLALPGVAEVATAAALAFTRPDGVGLGLVLVAGGVLAGLWVVTALVHVPLHRTLAADPTPGTIRRLVASNWMRTAGWSGRGLLVGLMVLGAL